MQIWEQIAADVESGAKRLVSECGARLYATAYRICGNEKDAEDLVQRTLVRTVERIESFNGKSAFFTWMCAILVNFHRMAGHCGSRLPTYQLGEAWRFALN